MPKKLQLTGKTFDKWTVLGCVGSGPRGGYRWNCRCDCGIERAVDANQLSSGASKSCGCARLEIVTKHAPNLRAISGVWNVYKNGAQHRKIKFELSLGHFNELTSQRCYFCNRPPAQKCSTSNNKYSKLYNGIDRMDNSKGYTLTNSFPCCGDCNRAKRCRTESDFLIWVAAIHKHHNL